MFSQLCSADLPNQLHNSCCVLPSKHIPGFTCFGEPVSLKLLQDEMSGTRSRSDLEKYKADNLKEEDFSEESINKRLNYAFGIDYWEDKGT